MPGGSFEAPPPSRPQLKAKSRFSSTVFPWTRKAPKERFPPPHPPTMIQSQTVIDQEKTERICLEEMAKPLPPLNTALHLQYCARMLGTLPYGFKSLDASKPWVVYWPVNALKLLGDDVSPLQGLIAATILPLQHSDGGFGGGVGQPGHLAATYAAVLSLAYSPESWDQIDRNKMHKFLVSLKQPTGGFRVCRHGETDPRATYTALCVASLLGILTPELTEGVGEYIRSCQTYEGGFANEPSGEAHGGYAFCAMATLFFLQEPVESYMDLSKFLGWLCQRQSSLGGFSGRTNKLVDGCYSHWVGSCWPLVEQISGRNELWSHQSLREFILWCCQDPRGGLRDKPDTKADAYHTNYVLCGLSGANYEYKMASPYEWTATAVFEDGVLPLNPLLGLPLGVGEKMYSYFEAAPGASAI